MSSKDQRADHQLHTLERWRRLELESAQAEHLARQATEREHQTKLDNAHAVVEQAQAFARAQCESGAQLSPDSLRLATIFAGVQQKALKDADAALKSSQQAVHEAHEQVVNRSENLFGIEKLRERRQQENARDALTSAQSALDEQALLKLSRENSKGR